MSWPPRGRFQSFAIFDFAPQWPSKCFGDRKQPIGFVCFNKWKNSQRTSKCENLSTLKERSSLCDAWNISKWILLSLFSNFQQVVRLNSPRQQISHQSGSQRVAQERKFSFVLSGANVQTVCASSGLPNHCAHNFPEMFLTDVNKMSIVASLRTLRTAGIDSSASRSNISVNCPLNHWNGPLECGWIGINLVLKLSESSCKSLSILGLSGFMFVSRGHVSIIFFFKIFSKFPNSSSVSSSPKLKFLPCSIPGPPTHRKHDDTSQLAVRGTEQRQVKHFRSSSRSLLKWKPILRKARLADPVNSENGVLHGHWGSKSREFQDSAGWPRNVCVGALISFQAKAASNAGLPGDGIWITLSTATTTAALVAFWISLQGFPGFRFTGLALGLEHVGTTPCRHHWQSNDKMKRTSGTSGNCGMSHLL